MSWLSRLLGWDDLLSEYKGTISYQYNTIVDLQTQLKETHEIYQDQLSLKDEEIRRLTDLMLTEHGVIIREGTPAEPKEKPIPIGRRASFRQIRNKYEAADRKMNEDILQARAEGMEKYYAEKNKKAEQEGVQ